jgi:hypothetical protein
MLFRWTDDVVTVIRPGSKVERGTIIPDWENATEHTVRGCSVQPTASTRDFADRVDQNTATFHMFAPYGSDIQAGDRIRCDIGTGGVVTFDIDGIPYSRKSPTGRVSSVQVDLIKWEG